MKNQPPSPGLEPTPPPQGYRPNAGVVLCNKEGLVWLGERVDISGAFQFPQGGIDAGETPEEAALRELWEETGVQAKEVTPLAAHPDWLTYKWPTPNKRFSDERLLGAAQKWFLYRFERPVYTDALLEKAPHKEFQSWRWASYEDAISGVISFRKPIYEAVFKVFSPFLK